MANELNAIRNMNFDWAMHVNSVWKDPSCDVPELQHQVREEIGSRLRTFATQSSHANPLGWIVTGSGGSGKTHLLSFLRRETHERHMTFVLVDMTDVHDFWETVLLGYLDSLHQTTRQGTSQHQTVLQRVFRQLVPSQPADRVVAVLGAASLAEIKRFSTLLLNALFAEHPGETTRHQHVVRAFVAMHSSDFTTAGLALSWLQGHAIQEEDLKALGLALSTPKPIDVVRGLSWFMSIAGPTVLALDQLDPIVSQLNIAAQAEMNETAPDELVVARAIIEGISAGLGALRDVASRTLMVVSCLENTWRILAEDVQLLANADRFEPPRALPAINNGALAEALVRGRVTPAFEQTHFRPPYATWPFSHSAFRDISGVTPRQLLKLCHRHCQRCLHQWKVFELSQFSNRDKPAVAPVEQARFDELEARFDQYRREADVAWLLDEKMGDARIAPLLQIACRALVHENPRHDNVEQLVDTQFGKDLAKCSLHARLRLCYTDEGDREEHFCLRAVQHANACAFQARVKAAITQSGIDRRLKFRRLAIVRTTAIPSGKVTSQLVARYRENGGLFLHPGQDELQTLWALWKLYEDNAGGLTEWLRQRKPVSKLPLMQQAVPICCDRLEDMPPTVSPTSPAAGRQYDVAASVDDKREPRQEPQENTSVSAVAARPGAECSLEDEGTAERPQARAERQHAAAESPDADTASEHRPPSVTMGRQVFGKTLGVPIHVTLKRLSNHMVVMAGSGSGKTVLLRHLIEEAALQGTPTIVIDCANDLATLGDSWPRPPAAWDAGQAAKAQQYFNSADTVIWTPGVAGGNPLRFEPLPDLSAVSNDADELQQAVAMVVATLRPIVAPGKAMNAQHKCGILSKALKFFAHQGGGSLPQLQELLGDLPPAAGLGLPNETKLAAQMAASLCVAMEMDPLLGGTGSGLDPAVLFGDVPGATKPRVSVINLVGLPDLESQRSFLNQLAMTLFAWIKRYPKPPADRPLRGLLVIDEAKDFVPTVKSTSCKESLMQLTAQARKYGLAMVFATQNPCEIEAKIVGNCAVKCFGRAAAPASIKVIQEQLHKHGAAGNDVAKLGKGNFYLCGARDHETPTKILVPMCLSHHRAPLSRTQVLQKAKASKQQLNAPAGTPALEVGVAAGPPLPAASA